MLMKAPSNGTPPKPQRPNRNVDAYLLTLAAIAFVLAIIAVIYALAIR